MGGLSVQYTPVPESVEFSLDPQVARYIRHEYFPLI